MSELSYGHVSAWLKYLYTADSSVLDGIPTTVIQDIAQHMARYVFSLQGSALGVVTIRCYKWIIVIL